MNHCPPVNAAAKQDVEKRKARTNETWTKKDRGGRVVHGPENAVVILSTATSECHDRTYLSLFLLLSKPTYLAVRGEMLANLMQGASRASQDLKRFPRMRVSSIQDRQQQQSTEAVYHACDARSDVICNETTAGHSVRAPQSDRWLTGSTPSVRTTHKCQSALAV